MLGNDVLATRTGGIYAPQRLAEDHPNEYHVQIMRLLCAYARHPTGEDIELDADLSEDVQSVMYAIRDCRQKDIALELEQTENFRLNLTRAHLRGADLSEINLSNADLPLANLSRTYLGRAVLSGAYFLNQSQGEIRRWWRSSGGAGSSFKYGWEGFTGATKPIFIAP